MHSILEPMSHPISSAVLPGFPLRPRRPIPQPHQMQLAHGDGPIIHPLNNNVSPNQCLIPDHQQLFSGLGLVNSSANTHTGSLFAVPSHNHVLGASEANSKCIPF